jgi:multidrug efflux pump subunit AcrA (membrane-fusion protein)
VPPAAIIRGAAATSVMVVDDESKAHRVEIETGITTDEAVEVVKGLKGGERVIVRGQNGLPDGAPVTVE